MEDNVLEYERLDPYPVHRFSMTIDGISSVIQFQDISGIEATTDVIKYLECGLIDAKMKKIPGRTTTSNITIKRGITDGDELWEWFQSVIGEDREVTRVNASITMYDTHHQKKKIYNLTDIWPCRYKSADLNASEDSVAFEEVEFVYEGVEIESE